MRRLLALVLLAFAGAANAETPSLSWQKWDPALFERAAREDKYILLHMAAVWCHWCHVMERNDLSRSRASSSASPQKFIAVRVDPGRRPCPLLPLRELGLARDHHAGQGRQRDLQAPRLHPARAVRQAAGRRDRGSLGAARLHLSAPRSMPNAAALAPERRERTEASWCSRATTRSMAASATSTASSMATRSNGCWSAADAERSNADLATWREVSARTLVGARHLIDPAWGGMFQYSDKLDWSGPHYEKLLNIQRDALRAYVLAYLDRPRARRPRRGARRRALADGSRALSGGRLYTSQDADAGPALHGDAFYARTDAERRARTAAADRPQQLRPRERLGRGQPRHSLRRDR